MLCGPEPVSTAIRPRSPPTTSAESLMTLEEYAAQARSLSDTELERILSRKIPTSNEAIAAKVERERRERYRAFWRKDIVAWILLLLSLVSIVVTFYFKKP